MCFAETAEEMVGPAAAWLTGKMGDTGMEIGMEMEMDETHLAHKIEPRLPGALLGEGHKDLSGTSTFRTPSSIHRQEDGCKVRGSPE